MVGRGSHACGGVAPWDSFQGASYFWGSGLRAAHPPSGDAGWCTIRTRGQDHQDASVGPGVIPQCWRSGMLGRLHNWRTHPADLHPGRAQDDLRAQRRLMVQGRLDGWLLRASVRSLRTAPLAHSSGEARPERRSREGGSSPSGAQPRPVHRACGTALGQQERGPEVVLRVLKTKGERVCGSG